MAADYRQIQVLFLWHSNTSIAVVVARLARRNELWGQILTGELERAARISYLIISIRGRGCLDYCPRVPDTAQRAYLSTHHKSLDRTSVSTLYLVA